MLKTRRRILPSTEALALWLSRGRTRTQKHTLFGQLVDTLGYQPAIGLWHDATERHRRTRSTCRASRDAWSVHAQPDGNGLITCPSCGDRVTSIPDPNHPGNLRIVDPHRVPRPKAAAK